jgi:hypothetical protein
MCHEQWCPACGCHRNWQGLCPECDVEPQNEQGPSEMQEWQDFDPDC